MKTESNSQNTWFGVSMFLIGLIAGGAITFGMSGGLPGLNGADERMPGGAPTAPTDQPTAMERMLGAAEAAGLDEDAFEKCFADFSDENILAEMEKGRTEGVSGTPGNILVNLKTKKAILLSGAQPFESFKTAIDELINSPSKPSAAGVEQPASVPELTSDDHVRGNRKADIAVFEYSDFQCPFCTRVHGTYKQIIDHYGDQVMWVYRHFPLTSIHPDAVPYSKGSECAAKLGGEDAFWSFTDELFKS
ncbi:MAG: thioredoxin domain-containing protein [Candidatus Peribacteraceae bacterium]